MSSGDAFLAPKRENTVSPILFHFNTGDKIVRGSKGAREGGKEVEIMRQSERKKREGGMQD